MKQKLLKAVAVSALLMSPVIAQADDAGWYLRGNVGAGTFNDADFTGDLIGDVEAETNGAASLGLGYEFGNGWRLEGDLNSLWNDFGSISQSAGTSADFRSTSAMLNAIYDFQDFERFEPYIGAGIGFVRQNLSAQSHDFASAPVGAGSGAVNVTNSVCTPICTFDDDDSSLGWQLLAGVGYKITDNLTWDTQYRYQNFNDADFTGLRTAPGSPTSANIATTFENLGSHQLLTGVRYRFGAAAAPTLYTCWDNSQVESLATCPARPVAVETFQCWDNSTVTNLASCPTQTFQCWDSSTVTDTANCPAQPTFTCWDNSVTSDAAFCPVQPYAELCAQEYRQEIIYYEFDKGQSVETQNTIQRILDTGQYCSVGNITVVGHTDTSGNAGYNLNLSKKRAKDARDELISRGIDSNIITSEGKGETQPFIDTGDGVKEQLNRRTEVLIRLNNTGVVN